MRSAFLIFSNVVLDPTRERLVFCFKLQVRVLSLIIAQKFYLKMKHKLNSRRA